MRMPKSCGDLAMPGGFGDLLKGITFFQLVCDGILADVMDVGIHDSGFPNSLSTCDQCQLCPGHPGMGP
jgi:hypothetical protein